MQLGPLASARATAMRQARRKVQPVAGRPDAETWDAYGDALRAAGRFAPAAEAYQRALALDPSRRTTKINIALALAVTCKLSELNRLASAVEINWVTSVRRKCG